MVLQPTPQQAQALEKIASRLEAQEPETRLFGYAGTGKTSIARYVAEQEPGEVLFAAYTGKAASVLTRKGCTATTLHSLMYTPVGDQAAKLAKLEEEYNVFDDPGAPGAVELYKRITEIEKNLGKPGFVLNTESKLRAADLLIVDEVSMVDDRLAGDLLGFGVPVIALGDPAQLPPVGKGGYFTGGGEAAADAMLTEIHRYAAESQIYRLATWIRDNKTRPPLKDGVVVSRVNSEIAMACDQILVGTNKTRRAKNSKMRKLLGFDRSNAINPGERFIVLDNNKDFQVLNGQQFRAVNVRESGRKGCIEVLAQCECPDVIQMKPGEENPLAFTCPDCHWFPRWIPVWMSGFMGESGEDELKRMPYNIKRGAVTATFGYAITVHKSQGSEWGSVLIFDESGVFRKDAWRWLYTAVTRSQDKVMVVRP